ncbi:hypothetical protein [Burkholderia sp. MSMB1589WGS]|uniref:hypothetical protein n=1 Tax=Burkholderia sp. MSMB1589WGS TaxID=1636425 RepID=UPI000A758893|nr:hypothetical protein [Burkholderia sp. MSMB1589WGS]
MSTTSVETPAAAERAGLPLTPLLIANFTMMAGNYAFVALAAPLARMLHLQASHIGAVIAVVGVVWIATARRWGRAADIRGRVPAMRTAIGMVIAPPLAGWIGRYDLAATLAVFALLPLAGLPGLGRLDDARPREVRGAPQRLKMTDARIRRPWLSAFALYSVIAIANSALGFYVIDWLHVDARHAAVVVGYALGCAGLGLIVMQSAVARLPRIAPLQWLRWGALASAAVDAREQGACAGTMSAAQGLSMIVAPLVGTALYDWRPQAPFALIGVLLLLLVTCATWRSARRAAATQ